MKQVKNKILCKMLLTEHRKKSTEQGMVSTIPYTVHKLFFVGLTEDLKSTETRNGQFNFHDNPKSYITAFVFCTGSE